MNPYYVAGQLIGAIIAVAILSRILFAGAKGWPSSFWKLCYVNALSAILAISWAIVGIHRCRNYWDFRMLRRSFVEAFPQAV
jgi:hypothetical protein